jgi:hypothetical protein
MAVRRQFSGVAVECATASILTIDGLTVDLTDVTGWPSLPSVPFFVAIDFDSVNLVEKCLATIVGSTLTLVRGQDGTTAKEHSAGAKVMHVLTAVDADEANESATSITKSGTAQLNFGNGNKVATVVVTGVSSALTTSRVMAQMRIEATASHLVDDLLIDPIRTVVKDLVAGVGFTIYGEMDNAQANGLYKVDWFISNG